MRNRKLQAEVAQTLALLLLDGAPAATINDAAAGIAECFARDDDSFSRGEWAVLIGTEYAAGRARREAGVVNKGTGKTATDLGTVTKMFDQDYAAMIEACPACDDVHECDEHAKWHWCERCAMWTEQIAGGSTPGGMGGNGEVWWADLACGHSYGEDTSYLEA